MVLNPSLPLKETRRLSINHLGNGAMLLHPAKKPIKNSPRVPQDMKLILNILYKSLYRLKGETIQRQSDPLDTEVIPLPQSV